MVGEHINELYTHDDAIYAASQRIMHTHRRPGAHDDVDFVFAVMREHRGGGFGIANLSIYFCAARVYDVVCTESWSASASTN